MSRSRTLLVILAALLFGGTAQAQTEDMLTAKNHFDDGQNLYLQGKYAEAAEKFRAAYQAKAYPAFLFNIAVCYEKNKDFAKALEHYERFIKDDPHTRDRKLVETRIDSIRSHLNPPTTQATSQPTEAKVELPPIEPKGLVVIESTPEGAAIYLNSKENGIFTRTPYTGSLPPGKHTVIIEAKEYRAEQKTFVVRNDRLTYLFFGLSAEKNLGWIEVKANIPGANVYIDSRDVGAVGRTPYSGNQRPGKRKIIVERIGYEPVTREVNIVAGLTHTIDVTLQKVAHGWLRVTGRTTQGARIKIDGQPIRCAEPPCATQLAVGSHHVVMEKDGFKTYEHTVEVEQAHEVKLAVRLNPSPPRIKAYVTYGVAAALLTGGIVAGVMSSNRASSLQDDLDQQRLYDSGDPRFTEGKVTAVIANVGFGLAALAAGLATYYLLRNEGPDSYGEATSTKLALTPGRLAITPTIGLNGAGVASTFRF